MLFKRKNMPILVSSSVVGFRVFDKFKLGSRSTN
jgi:hypothetical protein